MLVFTETWLGEGQQPPDIAGYRAYNYSRPAALQTGHARGGLACYIRQELCGHVHHVTCDPTSSFAVLRVSKEAGFEQDLYLIVCYIAPRCSTSISIASRSIWAQLEDSVSAALSKGQVLVVGDLNARTGTNADYTLYNIVDEHVPIGASPTSMQRSSQDGIVNSHGRELLGLCRRTGLRIVNGRVSGDETGAFTFVCPSGGASLIDYVIACPSAFGLVSQFAVVPAPCSDHLALQFSLVTDTHTASNPDQSGSRRGGEQPVNAPRVRRMGGAGNIKRWVEEVLPEYASELVDIEGSASTAAGQGREAVHRLCNRLEGLFAESFGLVQVQQSAPAAPRQPRWFDAELARGRAAATAAMRRDPRSAVSLQLRREYQRQLQRKQRRFKRSQAIALVNKAADMGKDFWQRFKPRKPVEASISKSQWLSHFRSLLGEVPSAVGSGSDDADACDITDPIPARCADGSELNQPFTSADVVRSVNLLHRGSSTLGFLTVEAFRAAAPLLAGAVAALFNACAQVGSLPPAWALCAITPIHKSGPVTDPGNYRGIAVGTVLAKMYATLLNSRLTKWAEANDLRAAGQAGFRQDHRCSDHLLVLRTVIEQQRIVKAPLYTCFVDFKKAYDTVPRDMLWTKLQRLGVHGWFLDGIKALYAEVPMAVKTAQGLTCTFDSVMGVKQGCPLSPTLFGLYLDDLEDAMRAKQHLLDAPSLDGLRLLALLYADDLALGSTSLAGLQAQLDVLHDYARRWGLTVNVEKTKAVIFRAASTPVCSNPSLLYDGESIDFVESFKYLGVDLHCTKPFADAGLPRKESGQRAMLAMLHRCRELGIDDPLLQVKLFDALVQPVMMYAVELWGASGVHKGDLAGDLVHRDFLRRLLGVRSGTPNMAVLAEVGRYPLQAFAAQMLLRYWNRLVGMDADRLVKRAFVVSAALAGRTAQRSRHMSWAGQAAAAIESLGMRCDLTAPVPVDVKHTVDGIQSKYLESVADSDSSKVQQYLRMRDDVVHETYSMAPYLRAVGGWRQRKRLAQFRTGSHWLEVEAGRSGTTAVPRDQRTCQRCHNGEVDDETHMVFRCAALSAQRRRHPQLFSPWPDSLRGFMGQDPTAVAAFVYECYKADKEARR